MKMMKMMNINMKNLEKIFQILLFILLILSLIIFINKIMNKHDNIKISTWQFPMLLALFIECIILL